MEGAENFKELRCQTFVRFKQDFDSTQLIKFFLHRAVKCTVLHGIYNVKNLNLRF